MTSPVNWRRLRTSLGHAGRGVKQLFLTENNFRVHILVAAMLIIAVIWLRVPRDQVALILMVVFSVLILELVNTVVERFADLLEPRVHPYVRVIKDLMAAGVLIAAASGVIIGVLIFWPYLSQLFKFLTS